MKQILRKTFLVLAAGIMSSAAWADGEIAFTAGNTIGATNNSTGWYGEASEIVAIGPHQRLTLKFKTYTATDAQLGSTVWNDQMTHALNIWDGQEQNLFMKGCGWGWKTHKDGGIEDPVDYNVNTEGVFNQKTYGWATDYRNMIGEGADVVMYIERNGSELSISQTFTTSANVKYYHYFSGIFGKTDGDVWLQMTIEKAHVDITADKELTDASIKGTLISIQNNTGGFKAGTNKDITIGKDGTAELNFKSFTNKINPFNGWGIEMQYGESFFNLTPGNKNMWGDLNQSPSTNWGTWPAEENDRKEAMDGATVKLTIARSGANVNVTAKHVTAAGVTHTITHSFTPTADGFATSDVTFRFFVEGGHLDLLSTNQEVYATIGSKGWTTFANADYALNFASVDGLTAYQITDQTGKVITKSEVTSAVQKNTGLLLNGTAGTTYTIPVAASGTALSGNKLVAGTGSAISMASGHTYYVLTYEDGDAQFKKLTSAVAIPAGKAYLDFPTTIEARSIDIDGDGTTGINMVNGEGLKVNGSEVYYDLQGRRVLYPKKGLYIVNGKKVILK